MIIQLILIILSVLLLVYFMSNQNTSKIRAHQKIAFILFSAAMIVFVLYPEALNYLAHKVGVGRGADLLLYCLFIAFVVLAISKYLKFKENEDKMHRLARKIALLEAQYNRGK